MKAADTIAQEYFGASREEAGEDVFDELVALIETDRTEHKASLRVDELHTALQNLTDCCRSHRFKPNQDETALADACALLNVLAVEGRDA